MEKGNEFAFEKRLERGPEKKKSQEKKEREKNRKMTKICLCVCSIYNTNKNMYFGHQLSSSTNKDLEIIYKINKKTEEN